MNNQTFENCPNCGKEMTAIESENIYYNYTSNGCECKKCGIKHFLRSYDHERWILPPELTPTEEQKNTLEYIRKFIPGISEMPITKDECDVFIQKYYAEARSMDPSVKRVRDITAEEKEILCKKFNGVCMQCPLAISIMTINPFSDNESDDFWDDNYECIFDKLDEEVYGL